MEKIFKNRRQTRHLKRFLFIKRKFFLLKETLRKKSVFLTVGKVFLKNKNGENQRRENERQKSQKGEKERNIEKERAERNRGECHRGKNGDVKSVSRW